MTELERKQDRAPVPSTWDYAPAPEARDLVQLRERYGHFVGGEWLEPRETYTTIDPSSEEALAEIGQATSEEVDLAVGAARDAFENGWSDISPAERAKHLYRIARILQERSREFAVLESLNGASRSASRATSTCRSRPRTSSTTRAGPTSSSTRSRTGPSPDRSPARSSPGTSRCSCSRGRSRPRSRPATRLSSSRPRRRRSQRCSSRTYSARPSSRRVVNIVTGDGRTGGALVKHPDVDKIAFTGSTEVGKSIQREPQERASGLRSNSGGKAANVIFDDAALDQAVEEVVNGIYFNQGHVCCAGSRLLVQESIFEPLVGKLKRRLATLRVGDPLDKNTDVGASTRASSSDKIKELVAAARRRARDLPAALQAAREGLLVRADGLHERRAELPDRAGGDLRPVLSVLTFRTPDEAVEKANNTPYGLAAGVWTEKGSRILAMAQQLRAGVIWANTYNRFDPASPFGGYKESGFGREAGGHGLEAYLEFESSRLPVRKTYKLYIGGEFPRSESGRTYEAEGANVARGSRKDVRDAVRAARSAFPKWAGLTPYNRGQVVYRIAEMLEARRAEFVELRPGRTK